jgi:hypothetical protein
VGRRPGEPGQDGLGAGGAVLDRGGVLDDLVVVVADQVPAVTGEIASDAAFNRLGELKFSQLRVMFPETGIG